MTLYTLIFSLVCVIAGTIVTILRPGDSVAMILFSMAGAGGVGAGFIAQSRATQQSVRAEKESVRADKEQRRADDLFQETQTMIRRPPE